MLDKIIDSVIKACLLVAVCIGLLIAVLIVGFMFISLVGVVEDGQLWAKVLMFVIFFLLIVLMYYHNE